MITATSSGCVLLKDGTSHPPVFIIHGLGSSLAELSELVSQIESIAPIYGLQLPGADGTGEPLETIQEMAEFFICAIRQLQPSGPYLLLGYSFGGLIALEIAQHLLRAREPIGLLMMIDSYPHYSHLATTERLRLRARRLLRRIGKGARGNQSSTERSPAMQRYLNHSTRALESYVPQFYRGEVTFIQATVLTSFPADPARVWEHLAETFSIQTVSGDHLTMLTTHAARSGSIVTRYLTSAFLALKDASL